MKVLVKIGLDEPVWVSVTKLQKRHPRKGWIYWTSPVGYGESAPRFWKLVPKKQN